MALYGLEWPYVASYGLVAFQGHGHVSPKLTLHCRGLFMALCCTLWSFMAEYRLFSRSQIQIHLLLLHSEVLENGQGTSTKS